VRGYHNNIMIKKKINKKQLSPSERHFGVVLEDIDSKLDLLVEEHQGLNNKVEELDVKVDRLNSKVEELDIKVDAVDRKVDAVDRKVENLRTEMDYKFELTFDELRLIRNELKEKIGRDEFALLEKRIVALEKSKK